MTHSPAVPPSKGTDRILDGEFKQVRPTRRHAKASQGKSGIADKRKWEYRLYERNKFSRMHHVGKQNAGLDPATIDDPGFDYFAGKIYDSSSNLCSARFEGAICFITKQTTSAAAR
jgi:hypothetical protein